MWNVKNILEEKQMMLDSNSSKSKRKEKKIEQIGIDRKGRSQKV